ncbi:MAG TPA: response regulator [Myxococcota bacterium]|nr:response regulator [Myxococcota bacterium]
MSRSGTVGAGAGRRTGAPRPVLLAVDDEPGILAALQRTLRREGYEIVAVDSVPAALRTLRERGVDLLLTDHKMPTASGLDLIREVVSHWPELPCFLLTGWAGEIDLDEVRRLGVRALIPKPWDDAELKATLREALEGG